MCGAAHCWRAVLGDVASDEVQTQGSRRGQALGHEESSYPSYKDKGSEAKGDPIVRETDPHSPDRRRGTLCILDGVRIDALRQMLNTASLCRSCQLSECV